MVSDIATVISFMCLITSKFVDLITLTCLPEEQSPSSIIIMNSYEFTLKFNLLVCYLLLHYKAYTLFDSC